MILKKLLTFTLLLSILACSKDEDDDSGPVVDLNRDLAGKIDGKSWTYVQGKAESYENISHYFSMVDSNSVDSCSLDSKQATINVAIYTNNEKELIGKHPIVTTEDNYVELVFNFVNSEGAFWTYFATSGQVTITEADTINKVVRGNLNAVANDGQSASGKFELRYCEY